MNNFLIENKFPGTMKKIFTFIFALLAMAVTAQERTSYNVSIASENDQRGLVNYSYRAGAPHTPSESHTFTASEGDLISAWAMPKNGWKFKQWTENGQVVATAEELQETMGNYIFNLHEHRNLVAEFKLDNSGWLVGPTAYVDNKVKGGFHSLDVFSTYDIEYTFDNVVPVDITSSWGTVVMTHTSNTARIYYKLITYGFDKETQTYRYSDTKPTFSTGFGGFVPAATQYTEPITVPMGYSWLRFVVLDEQSGWSFQKRSEEFVIKIYRREPKVIVSTDHNNYGTVSGGGTYSCGEEVTVKATPREGYRFVCWEQISPYYKRISNDAEFKFKIESDTELEAVFEPTPFPLFFFDDDRESDDKNATLIAGCYNDNKFYDVHLRDRILWCDKRWNTICLPFSLPDFSAAVATPLRGATVKKLVSSSYTQATKTLTLNFKTVDAIEAGKPYIVRWETPYSESAIPHPVFEMVQISSNAASKTETDFVDFVGNYSTINLTGDDRTVLYLGSGSKLYYPRVDMPVNAFRGVFRLKGLTAGDLPGSEAKNIVLDFGDGETTSIDYSQQTKMVTVEENYHSIDGRKLVGKPTAKGVYIQNGRKVVIK